MTRLRLSLTLCVLYSAALSAAELVKVPSTIPALPLAGLEPNRGQTRPDILFLSRGIDSIAVKAQTIEYSPRGLRMSFVAGNPNSPVRFLDPLPGVANSFTGADAQKWISGIPRFSTAQIDEIYPGIDAQYTIGGDGVLVLKFMLRPGIDPKAIIFELAGSSGMVRYGNGLDIRFGNVRFDQPIRLPAPTAVQATPAGNLTRALRFEILSTSRFGFQVEDRDSSLPLLIEMKLGPAGHLPPVATVSTTDSAGNTFVATTVSDAAGRPAPFPVDYGTGCGSSATTPTRCTDAAVYKFSKNGDLIFASYFAGGARESAESIGLAPDGSVFITGNTESADFPVTFAALQPTYAGPPAKADPRGTEGIGDFFAAKLDASTGRLVASTYFGGPSQDKIGETAIGSDGSLYFIPRWHIGSSVNMPVSSTALLKECAGEFCYNGYAARLSPALDRMIFGTYLPGRVQASAKVHTDGSVYYAGTAAAGFPATPGAFQQQPAGKEDGIVGRLDPSGSRLLFGTYIGGPETDWALGLTVAPDGSPWVTISTFVQCCVGSEKLVRFDPQGTRVLVDKPIDAVALTTDRDGNLFAIANGKIAVGPDAFLESACPYSNAAYLKLSPTGEQVFGTYLPAGAATYFDGVSQRGLPIIPIYEERFEIVQGQSPAVFAGCMTDSASFSEGEVTSPGALVTVFGTGLGPRTGVAFQLQNGSVPMQLGGTRVLVDGEPVPLLYASHTQVNAILPYTLKVGSRPTIRVVSASGQSNELGRIDVSKAGVSFFRLDNSTSRPAAALNEDGTVNSPQNPAKKGSRVVIFGTGGGATLPASVAGQLTPLELRPLENEIKVRTSDSKELTIEYAGGAPGLPAGVLQVNVKLPEVVPANGRLSLTPYSPLASFYPGPVTIAVTPD